MNLISPIPLPLDALVPLPEVFQHPSELHGQLHVARVMVHAFALVEREDAQDLAPALWAAVYLHDTARTHDGLCDRHGADAMARLAEMPELRELLAQGGVRDEDYPAIETAVTWHCRWEELVEDHPHRRLTAFLKDADGLDRVRLGDLDPDYLRLPASRALVPFAQALYLATQGTLEPGPGLFSEVWEVAQVCFGSKRFQEDASRSAETVHK